MVMTVDRPAKTNARLEVLRAGRPSLSAARLIQSTGKARRLGKYLLGLLVLAIAACLFVPWQQTARGTGRVVSYSPFEREQTVTSPVEGIVLEVRPDLREGTFVRQDEILLRIQPKAANLLEQLIRQKRDLEDKLLTATNKAEAYQDNVVAYEAARDAAVASAQNMIDAARAKLDGKTRGLEAYVAKEKQAKLNYERQRNLEGKGVTAQRQLEIEERSWEVAKAELAEARQLILEAEQELASKQQELEQKRQEYQAKVDYSKAMVEDASGHAATARKEIREIEVKLSELERLEIRAPLDGFLHEVSAFPSSLTVKEGDYLMTIVPRITQRAVELEISGNDIPLVQSDDEVRLQFEGWPALQFAGWPNIAFGTFGGVVSQVNPTDNGTGRFRIVVTPDPNDPTPWPTESERFLRPGVRANGWVILGQVSLGYEIWRQLNGFPPVVPRTKDKASEEMKPIKTPKLPKA
jgi:multidrug resistance efflux pump